MEIETICYYGEQEQNELFDIMQEAEERLEAYHKLSNCTYEELYASKEFKHLEYEADLARRDYISSLQ